MDVKVSGAKDVKEEVEEVEEEEEEGEEGEEEEEDEDGEEYTEGSEDDGDKIPIDLSTNEVYRGICTLFEDEEGNNILEYISLLHTELIGINKSMEHLKGIRKELTRIADCAESMTKSGVDSSDDRKQKKVEKSNPSKK